MGAPDIDDLTREFVIETREMIEGVSASLLAWEDDPADRATLDAVFRLVHTVKGSCGFVDQPRIGALAHAAEEVLSAARDGQRIPDRPLVGALLALVDRIGRLVEALDGGEAPDLAGDAALVAALDKPEVAPQQFMAAPAAAASTIRVPVTLLETIMAQVSDLVLVRNDLARRLRDDADTAASLAPLTHVVGELRDSVARARLQPIERLFRGLPRLVRDTAAALGKDVALTIEGDDVEIDREMVEALKDPLMHIVRNAIDHGVEGDRGAAGKPARAALIVSARQSGNQVAISIADDGRGIDVARLAEKAGAAGITVPSADVAQLIFEPGFSTANQVNDISGRGVGMDVVRTNIERIGGSVMLDNRPGAGLTVHVRVPLTLSILTCLIVEAGGQRFAVPRAAIDEVVAIGSDGVRYEPIGDSHLAAVRGSLLSVVPLAAMLGLDDGLPSRLVVIDMGGTHFVMPVDAVLTLEELVVRPLAPGVAHGLFAGQSLSDDGQPLLMLDVLGLAKAAEIARGDRRAPAATVGAIERPVSALLFESLGGKATCIRAVDVARIEDVSRDAFLIVGDEVFVTIDGATIPVMLDGALPESGMVATIRLAATGAPRALAVARVSDLVPIGEITVVTAPAYEGLIFVDGQSVPLLARDAPPEPIRLAA